MANPFSKSDYTDEQWRRACAYKVPNCSGTAKQCYKLPIKSPQGNVSPGAVESAIRMVGHISGISEEEATRIQNRLRKMQGKGKSSDD
jgi:hypothetical protein